MTGNILEDDEFRDTADALRALKQTLAALVAAVECDDKELAAEKMIEVTKQTLFDRGRRVEIERDFRDSLTVQESQALTMSLMAALKALAKATAN